MSELYEAVRREIDEFRGSFDDILSDGKITLSEVVPFVQACYQNIKDVVAAFVIEAEKMGGDKEARRKAILAALDQMYDEVIEPLNLPGPDRVLDPLFKMGLLESCDWAIQYLQGMIGEGGKFKLVRDEG